MNVFKDVNPMNIGGGAVPLELFVKNGVHIFFFYFLKILPYTVTIKL